MGVGALGERKRKCLHCKRTDQRADHKGRLVSSKPIGRDASEDSLYICALLDMLVLVLKTTQAILLSKLSERSNNVDCKESQTSLAFARTSSSIPKMSKLQRPPLTLPRDSTS